MHALFDAFVQRRTRRLQANLDGSIAFQAGAPGAMDFRKWTPSEQAYFNGTNHLRAVARPDAQCSLRVQTPQDPMQVLEAVLVRARFQARSQFLRTCWGIGQAFEQRTQIQPRSNSQNRKPGASAQVFENLNRPESVFPRGKCKARVHQIQHMVWNTFALFAGRLCGANIKTPIDLGGIAGQHLATKLAGEPRAQRRFSRGRRSHNGYKRNRARARSRGANYRLRCWVRC